MNSLLYALVSILNSSASGSKNFASDKYNFFSVDNQQDGQDQDTPQDSAQVTLHQGTRPSPISEAHAVVRPIVNIIVPNNRADLLSEGG